MFGLFPNDSRRCRGRVDFQKNRTQSLKFQQLSCFCLRHAILAIIIPVWVIQSTLLVVFFLWCNRLDFMVAFLAKYMATMNTRHIIFYWGLASFAGFAVALFGFLRRRHFSLLAKKRKRSLDENEQDVLGDVRNRRR